MQRTAIDLFCGAGGLTEGLKQAGIEVLAAVDNDPLAIESYQVNHPEVEVWERDIRELSPDSLMRRLGLMKGALDILAGCPPCQGFSRMRTLNGAVEIQDERNDLVFDFMRFVTILQPKVVMMENVPGLARDKRILRVLGELEEAGYYIDAEDPESAVRVLNTADYRVAQRRRRMILLAGRYGPVKFASPVSQRVHVRETIGQLSSAGNSGDDLHDYPERRSERIMNLIKKIPPNGGSRSELPDEEQLECHKKCNGFRDVYGRLAWDDVAPTITSGCTNPSKGRFLHPEEHRAITLREAALLQSFPEHYHFSLKRGKQEAARLIGNALPPCFIKYQAEAIKQHLEQFE